MDPKLSIRPARAPDFAVLAPPIAALPVFAPYKFEAQALQKRWEKALTESAQMQVALLTNTPVGLCWYIKSGTFGTGAYLRFLSVTKQAQGLGAGTQLLSAYEQACQSAPGGLFVLTSQHNTAAAAFYSRHGYSQIGALPDFAVAGTQECIFWKRRAARTL